MKKNIFWSSLLVLALFLVGFFLINHFPKKLAPEDIKQVEIGGQVLNIDLALTSEIQERGLSGRTELKENEGMLFVFPQPGQYAFWMKDMNFPLDIIWIGEDLKVVYIQKNALPESYPESFSPGKNAKYVLEVSTNFADKNNLKEGDSVSFVY